MKDNSGGPNGSAEAGLWVRNQTSDADCALARLVANQFSAASMRAACAAIRSWPGYAATPLVALVEEAAALHIATVHAKLERRRFGMGSFKSLGGAFAVLRHSAGCSEPHTFVCGSAGNHGLSVAWGARRAGCPAVIFVPEGTRAARIERIRAQGAEVQVVVGAYEEALARASRAASDGAVLISDYAERNDPVTMDVMRGYTVIGDEIAESGVDPTHLFVPAGVGGLAAALVAYFRTVEAAARPKIVVVEPVGAACVLSSLRADRRVRLPWLNSRLAPLACRTPSAPAWPFLRAGVDAAVTVTDDEVTTAGATLGTGSEIAPDACGAAALAGVRTVGSDPAARRSLGLTPKSRVLLLVTE